MRRRFRSLVRAGVRSRRGRGRGWGRGWGWVWVPVVAFVVVVAMAMACAVWSPVDRKMMTPGGSPFGNWEVPSDGPRYDNDPPSSGFRTLGFGVSLYYHESPFRIVDALALTGRENGIAAGEAGFPFRCLWYRRDTRRDSSASSWWVAGIETPIKRGLFGTPRRIPLMPEPVGMVLNVLIVSAAIVLVRAAWRRAVVFRRRCKGLCVQCAYPIESSVGICPECGQAYAKAKAPTPA